MKPARLLAVSVLGTLLGLAGLWTVAHLGGSPGPARAAERLESSAADILGRWDAERSRAWASGDLDALSGLYVDGSRSGRADVARLRAWTDAGLTVRGLDMQILELEVLDHTEARWELAVTDRVGRAVAVGAGRRVVLPTDQASSRTITLLATPAGRWQVATVR